MPSFEPQRICPNIEEECIIPKAIPRADEGLKIKKKVLPNLEDPDECSITQTFHPIVNPGLARLPKFYIPDPKRICNDSGNACSPRADERIRPLVIKKKLPAIIPRPCTAKYFSTYCNLSKNDNIFSTFFTHTGRRYLSTTPNEKKKCKNVCKRKKTKCPSMKIDWICGQQGAKKIDCSRIDPPYMSFSECRDEDPSIAISECPGTSQIYTAAYLQPKNPVFKGYLKWEPVRNDQVEIDLNKEEDCVMKLMGLKRESGSTGCPSFGKKKRHFYRVKDYLTSQRIPCKEGETCAEKRHFMIACASQVECKTNRSCGEIARKKSNEKKAKEKERAEKLPNANVEVPLDDSEECRERKPKRKKSCDEMEKCIAKHIQSVTKTKEASEEENEEDPSCRTTRGCGKKQREKMKKQQQQEAEDEICEEEKKSDDDCDKAKKKKAVEEPPKKSTEDECVTEKLCEKESSNIKRVVEKRKSKIKCEKTNPDECTGRKEETCDTLPTGNSSGKSVAKAHAASAASACKNDTNDCVEEPVLCEPSKENKCEEEIKCEAECKKDKNEQCKESEIKCEENKCEKKPDKTDECEEEIKCEEQVTCEKEIKCGEEKNGCDGPKLDECKSECANQVKMKESHWCGCNVLPKPCKTDTNEMKCEEDMSKKADGCKQEKDKCLAPKEDECAANDVIKCNGCDQEISANQNCGEREVSDENKGCVDEKNVSCENDKIQCEEKSGAKLEVKGSKGDLAAEIKELKDLSKVQNFSAVPCRPMGTLPPKCNTKETLNVKEEKCEKNGKEQQNQGRKPGGCKVDTTKDETDKGLWQKICEYFKARPNCPTAEELRKKRLREDAERAAALAGLCICEKPEKKDSCEEDPCAEDDCEEDECVPKNDDCEKEDECQKKDEKKALKIGEEESKRIACQVADISKMEQEICKMIAEISQMEEEVERKEKQIFAKQEKIWETEDEMCKKVQHLCSMEKTIEKKEQELCAKVAEITKQEERLRCLCRTNEVLPEVITDKDVGVKCGKGKREGVICRLGKKCKTIKLANCPPRVTCNCVKVAPPRPPCSYKEAPYASFSECYQLMPARDTQCNVADTKSKMSKQIMGQYKKLMERRDRKCEKCEKQFSTFIVKDFQQKRFYSNRTKKYLPLDLIDYHGQTLSKEELAKKILIAIEEAADAPGQSGLYEVCVSDLCQKLEKLCRSDTGIDYSFFNPNYIPSRENMIDEVCSQWYMGSRTSRQQQLNDAVECSDEKNYEETEKQKTEEFIRRLDDMLESTRNKQ